MNTHVNYFEIEADSYYDLGRRKGELFGDYLQATLEERRKQVDWRLRVEKAGAYVQPTASVFPHLLEEAHGYAEGCRGCFQELWVLMLEDELSEGFNERCTTVVTNRGMLIGHNEDWERNAKGSICVLRKKVRETSIFELFYMNTLGGNAISFNSHGYMHAVNSLPQQDSQIGVPKNIVARWLSETSDLQNDFKILQSLRRASGYHHTFVNPQGDIWSIECSATRQHMSQPTSPFVHTNHFVTPLSRYSGDDHVPGTRQRYQFVARRVADPMTLEDMKKMICDTSAGNWLSVLNERTIAQVLFDLNERLAHVWLAREKQLGWITYPL